MVGFQSKRLGPRETLGNIFERRREALGFSLATASRKTGIGKHYLLALEEGRYTLLPGLIYGKNFVKVYSTILGLSQAPLVRAFAEEYCIATAATPRRATIVKHDAPSSPRLRLTPFHVRMVLAASLMILLGLYFGGEIVALIRPPLLIVEEPQENLLTTAREISVAGSIDPAATLMVNEEYSTHTDGIFFRTVDLHEGTNTITVRAFRRHGRDRVVTRTVVRQASEVVARGGIIF